MVWRSAIQGRRLRLCPGYGKMWPLATATAPSDARGNSRDRDHSVFRPTPWASQIPAQVSPQATLGNLAIGKSGRANRLPSSGTQPRPQPDRARRWRPCLAVISSDSTINTECGGCISWPLRRPCPQGAATRVDAGGCRSANGYDGTVAVSSARPHGNDVKPLPFESVTARSSLQSASCVEPVNAFPRNDARLCLSWQP